MFLVVCVDRCVNDCRMCWCIAQLICYALHKLAVYTIYIVYTAHFITLYHCKPPHSTTAKGTANTASTGAATGGGVDEPV